MTDMNDTTFQPRGTVYYDADCALCLRLLERFGPIFQRRGFVFRPLKEGMAADCAPFPANAKNTDPRYVSWDGETIGEWTNELEGASALINLTGKSVNCRYTKHNQDVLLRSRIQPTRLLGQAVQKCVHPPAIWMNASTATLYRHTFDHPWTENGAIGAHPDAKDAFSIQLCPTVK